MSDEPRSYTTGGWLPPGYAQVYDGAGVPLPVACAALSELLRDYFYEVWHTHRDPTTGRFVPRDKL